MRVNNNSCTKRFGGGSLRAENYPHLPKAEQKPSLVMVKKKPSSLLKRQKLPPKSSSVLVEAKKNQTESSVISVTLVS